MGIGGCRWVTCGCVGRQVGRKDGRKLGRQVGRSVNVRIYACVYLCVFLHFCIPDHYGMYFRV